MKIFTLKIGEPKNRIYPVFLLDPQEKELGQRKVEISPADLRNLAEIDSIIRALEKEIYPQMLLLNRGKEMYDRFIGEEFSKILLGNGRGRTHLCIEISEKAFALARLPWDLMHDGERYLIEKGFSFSQSTSDAKKDPNGLKELEDKLRVLVIMSLPEGTNELAFALEEEELREFFDQNLNRKYPVELEILQYGTTEDALERKLNKAGGYHIIHFSGHGAENELIFENNECKPAPLSGFKFAQALKNQENLKLVVLSACLSGEIKEYRRPKQEMDKDIYIGRPPSGLKMKTDEPLFTGVACELLRAGIPLVLAMRYPVEDRFAREFVVRFYQEMFENGNNPASSLFNTKKSLFDPNHHKWITPALFGGRSTLEPIALPLKKTKGEAKTIPPSHQIHQDLIEPKLFVGRYHDLAKIRRELIEGDKTSAILWGIGGIGKTTLAAKAISVWKGEYDHICTISVKNRAEFSSEHLLDELNYFFRVYSNIELPELPYTQIAPLPFEKKIEYFVNYLESILNQKKFLLVIDNLESCLESVNGKWHTKDRILEGIIKNLMPRLTTSRLIVTSRYRPHIFEDDDQNLLPISVDEFSVYETLNYIEKCKNLSQLLSPERYEIYRLTKGLPFVLEKLEVLAKDKEKLRKLLNDFKENRLQWGETELYKDYIRYASVEEIFRNLSDKAKKLLAVMSLFEETIEAGILQMLIEDEELKGLSELVNVGFAGVVEFEKGKPFIITIHPFMKEFGSKQVELLGLDRNMLLKKMAGIYSSIGISFYQQEEKEPELTKKTLLRRQGVEALRRAWTYHFAIGEYKGAYTTIMLICDELEKMGFRQEAKDMLNKIIPKLKEEKDKASCFNNLGVLFREERKNQEALNSFKKALEIFEKKNEKWGVTTILNNMGNLYYQQGNLVEAMKMWEESLKMSEELKDDERIADTLVNIANIHTDRGDFDQALELIEKTRKIYEKQKRPDKLALTLRGMGIVYCMKRNYKKSLESLEESVELLQKLGDELGAADTMVNIATVLTAIGELEKAIDICKEVLNIFQKQRQPNQIAVVLGEIGTCFFLLEKYQDALTFHKRSLRIKEDINNLEGMAISHHQIGRILEETKHFKAALAEFVQALSIFDTMEHEYVETVKASIKRIRKELGKSKFIEYWREITGEEKLPEWLR